MKNFVTRENVKTPRIFEITNRCLSRFLKNEDKSNENKY